MLSLAIKLTDLMFFFRNFSNKTLYVQNSYIACPKVFSAVTFSICFWKNSADLFDSISAQKLLIILLRRSFLSRSLPMRFCFVLRLMCKSKRECYTLYFGVRKAHKALALVSCFCYKVMRIARL